MTHRTSACTGGLFSWSTPLFNLRQRGFPLSLSRIPAGAYSKKRNPYPGFLTPDQHPLFHRILSDTCRVLVRGVEEFAPEACKRGGKR